MRRKLTASVLALSLAAGLAACGSPAGEEQPAAGGDYDLRLVNGKIEVDADLKELAAAYEAETGVRVQIESMGGGVDVQGTLKGYYQADNMPDIFVCNGGSDFANWDGLLSDMSDEAWAADTGAAFVDGEGRVLGFPYTTEAIGLTYNADTLKRAGIDPASITGPESMRAAFETLDAQKEALGLTAVIGYCAEAINLYWSTGNHLFGVYEDAGLARDDTTYFDLLSDGGQIDAERFSAYAEMIALFNRYSDPALLVSGTYDRQILNFAAGKYAFVTQGSWIGASMTSDYREAYKKAGSFAIGMLPYAFEEGIDTIQTNAPSWWAVFKGENETLAKDFLAWCAGDAGQRILVEEAGFISPFASCAYTASDPFAATIAAYTAAGRTSAWHWLGNREGLAQNALGVVYQDFAGGGLDTEGFCRAVSSVCTLYYKF